MYGGIGKTDLKRLNRMQMLRSIWESGPISRVDLSSTLQITRASVTQLSTAMIEEGVLMEIGEAPHHHNSSERMPKGRRKILLDLNPNYRFVLGAVIGEHSVSVGLCTIHMDILEKKTMFFRGHCSRKEIINFITQVASDMLTNSCLKPADVLGLGVGVMPIMIGRMRVFYKDGLLDFAELCRDLSRQNLPPVHCGNAVWLLALANADLHRGEPRSTDVLVHLGSHVHIAKLQHSLYGNDTEYETYSYLTERSIIRTHGGRQQDGYPAGSVRAQLSVGAMQARTAQIYSKERTPFLYSSTDGYIEQITLEELFRAISVGDKLCEEIVQDLMRDWSVLLHNLVCSFHAQRLVLHNFSLSEWGFGVYKQYLRDYIGEEITDRLQLSLIEGQTDFLGGCVLVLMKQFFCMGGMT